MHIPDPDAVAASTTAAALKKRKRDGAFRSHENIESIEGNISPYQLDYQDINMLAPASRFIPDSSSRPQWLHLQQNASAPVLQKKRKILQPHSNRQPQSLRPHSGGHSHSHNQAQSGNVTTKKSSLPTLTIPSFNNHLDPSLSSMSGSDEDLVSPRTTTASLTPLFPPPVLRPCHVCHRKPSTKVMLDAYADCDLCGQRACYICLRECNSINCGEDEPTNHQGEECGTNMRREDGYLHTTTQFQQRPTHYQSGARRQRKICSCCAVEGLTDTGDEIVWCMSCVRREETSQRMWQ